MTDYTIITTTDTNIRLSADRFRIGPEGHLYCYEGEREDGDDETVAFLPSERFVGIIKDENGAVQHHE